MIKLNMSWLPTFHVTLAFVYSSSINVPSKPTCHSITNLLLKGNPHDPQPVAKYIYIYRSIEGNQRDLRPKDILMAPKMGLFLLYIFLSSSLCTAQPNNSSDDVKRWCDTTPHPEPCMYFMRHGGRPFAPKRRADFRNLMVQVSRDQTLGALTHTVRLGPRCKNEHQRAAWADCLKLYDNTLDQINRTLTSADTNSSYTIFDEQTWLSTSLTNLETCRLGSVELGVSGFISPILSYNVSELLSNSLAINEGLMEKQHDYEDEYKFPSWVSTGERRLLQTAAAAVKANLVVAKDGSGNYRTIQAALDAAAKRSGSGRFIIHVKSGVYKENIEVSTSMNDIMLLGDGLRKTIITGSRSVNGGSTTYNSATVGTAFFFSLFSEAYFSLLRVNLKFLKSRKRLKYFQNASEIAPM